MKRKNVLPALMIALLSFPCIKPLNAEIITFYPVQVVGGETAPAGQPPWISATFNDHDEQGSVTLTLACLNLTGDEYVSRWLFNLDPALNPKKLKFTSLLKTGSFTTPTIWTGANSFAVDGEYFDILFLFSNADGHSKRFDTDNSWKVKISGISTLTAQSFNFNSQGTPCYGSFPTTTEAYIRGIGRCRNDDSWIAIPEPSSFVPALCGLLGMACYLRRKKM